MRKTNLHGSEVSKTSTKQIKNIIYKNMFIKVLKDFLVEITLHFQEN